MFILETTRMSNFQPSQLYNSKSIQFKIRPSNQSLALSPIHSNISISMPKIFSIFQQKTTRLWANFYCIMILIISSVVACLTGLLKFVLPTNFNQRLTFRVYISWISTLKWNRIDYQFPGYI
jgi:hypothetical protein